jgi:hypothetical protein
VSGCEATPEIKRIIRAMAKAKLEEGFTHADDIVDEIHAAINDHTPLWKGEIADIISGYGQERRQATKTELQERVTQLKRDLRAIYHPEPPKPTPEQQKNITRQRAIQKQIQSIKDQIAAGQFEKPEPRSKPVYNDETMKAQGDLAQARRQVDKLMAKFEYDNHSRAYKMVDTALAFHRASILSGINTIGHLTGAALMRMASTPLDQLAGALLQHVPGIKKFSENAPTEGGGFQGAALGAALGHAFSKATLVDMWNKLREGQSDLQAIHKSPIYSSHRVLDLIGHLHDAIKTPAENFGYTRALVTFQSQTRNQLARSGMSPQEIDNAMDSEAMKARGAALAYGESQRAKLQGDNALVNGIRMLIKSIENTGVGGKAAATAINYTIPILKIPTNMVGEASSYAIGGTKAVLAMMNSKKGKFTPEQNDYILRNLKKGLVGKALAVVAWTLYQSFGGLYDSSRKQKSGEPGYGDIKTPYGTISHAFMHSPIMSYMQAVALAHRVYDEQVSKGIKKGDDDRAGAALTAGAQSTKSMLQALPFVDAPAEFFKSISDSAGIKDYLGKMASSNVPAMVRDIAQSTDPEKALKRHPSTFTQEIENVIPGLRENVPLGSYKHMTLDQKLDAYDKMSPAERDSTNMLQHISDQARRMRTPLTDDQQARLDKL